jgi:hypothetical protein
MDTFYTILNVHPQASSEEIRAAFKKLAMRFHPDRNPDNPQAEETFKLINLAYQTLSNEQKRLSYDYQIGLRSRSTSYQTYYEAQEQAQKRYQDMYREVYRRYQEEEEEKQKAHESFNKKIHIWIGIGLAIVFMLSFFIKIVMDRVTAQHHFQNAQTAYLQGNFTEAERSVYLAIGKQSDVPEYLMLLLRIEFQHKKRYGVVQESIQYLISLLPKLSEQPLLQRSIRAELYAYQGKIFYLRHEYEAALEQLKNAEYLGYSDGSLLLYKAKALMNLRADHTLICKYLKEAFYAGEPEAKSFLHVYCSD